MKTGIAIMLVKATLTQLTTLESLAVLWNPERYVVERVNHLAAPAAVGEGRSLLQFAAGGSERLRTRLFLDASSAPGGTRDVQRCAARLDAWAAVEGSRGLPPPVLFHWGTFRFRGVIEELVQEWIRFDADGTPNRGWLDLTLRR